MAINLTEEKERKLTTQDMYDILHFAVQSAEDNGFVNSFIFERALYEYAAIILFPDRKEEIGRMVAENINNAWDALVQDGTIDKLLDDYSLDMHILADEGNIWLEEYTKYLHSARGLLNTFQMFSGDIVNAAVERFKTVSDDANVQQVLDIADRWGMNNAAKSVENATTKDDTLKEGKTKVLTKGENGEAEVTYQVKYVNGKKKESAEVSRTVVKKAIQKEVAVGTKDEKETDKDDKKDDEKDDDKSTNEIEPNGVKSKNGYKLGQVIDGKYSHYCACAICNGNSRVRHQTK